MGTEKPHGIDEQAALRAIVEGTAGETGQRLYAALVENLARTLDAYGAWVTEYHEDRRVLSALALWLGGEWVEGLEYDIKGTACETAIDELRLVHIPDRLLELYQGSDPRLERIARIGPVSYLGVPLLDGNDRVLGQSSAAPPRRCPTDAFRGS